MYMAKVQGLQGLGFAWFRVFRFKVCRFRVCMVRCGVMFVGYKGLPGLGFAVSRIHKIQGLQGSRLAG
jgi:hypothetical protein